MAFDHARHEEHAAAVDQFGGAFGGDLVASPGNRLDAIALDQNFTGIGGIA